MHLTNEGPGKLLGHWCSKCWQCCTAHCFCNEKGKISSGEDEDGAGLWVCCGELGGASSRAKATGSATSTHDLSGLCQQWGNINSQSQKHLPPKLLDFFLHSCLGLHEEHASTLDRSPPRSLCVGASSPWDFLVAVWRKASFHCVSLWNQN